MKLLDRLRRSRAKPRLSETVDLDDPASSIDPFPLYDRLRREGDVLHLPRHGFWIVLGHRAARSVFEQPEIFSNCPYRPVDSVLLAADPPRHGDVRRLVSRHFGGEALRRLEAHAIAVARTLLRPEMDIVAEFARPLSLSVARELAGFDEGTVEEIVALEQRLRGAADEFARFAAGLDRLADRSVMFRLLMAEGRELIDEEQARSLVRLMWLASSTTTERTVSQAVLRLVTETDMPQRLARDRELLPAFVEEVIRLHPPEALIRRMTTCPVSLAGVAIPEGAYLQLCLPAANRDPDWIDAPGDFRLDRGALDHLSFGNGIHRCVGAPLTRRTVAAAVTVLLEAGRPLRPLQPLDQIPYTHSMIAFTPRELRLGV